MPLVHVVAAFFISIVFVQGVLHFVRSKSAVCHRADTTLPTALFVVLTLVTVICFRSLRFGVDTVYYSAVFKEYCVTGAVPGLERSFSLSALLLNVSMFGRCDIRLLPAAWVLLFALFAFLVAGSLSFRLHYVALLLFSMIGLELVTNALRQGLSIALLVVAISNWRAERLLAVVAATGAILLHGSASLALASTLIALLPWSYFLVLLVIGILWVSWNIHSTINVPGVTDFLFEIQKYLAHESDEVWVRVLAFAALGATLAAVIGVRRVLRLPTAGSSSTSWAAKLCLVCVPFLAVPYFGYRFIYALYPIVLWILLKSLEPEVRGRSWFFCTTVAVNAGILMAWSGGSTYMRTVPFFQ